MAENLEFDDAEQQKRRGSAASWSWKSIAQVIPGLMLRSVGDKSREGSQGYDPRPQEEREQKTILASVLDRVATVIAKVEAKIDAGPRVSEQTASQTLGITPEAVRQYAPELGIPYETAKTGEVSFRKNQLRFAAVPAEAERLPLGIEAATKTEDLPEFVSGQTAVTSQSPAEKSQTAATQQKSPGTYGIGSRAADAAKGAPAPAAMSVPQQGPLAAVPQSQTASVPQQEPLAAGSGTLASFPPDATVGMGVRGVENRDSVIHRLSQSAQQAFGLPRSHTKEAETLSPGEAASVPPGAKITVEVDGKDKERSTAGSSRDSGDRRPLSRRIADRLLPVSAEERQQRGQPGTQPSRAMRYRNALRGFGIRGKRATRQLSQRLGQMKFAKTRVGGALVGAGQRGLQAAGTGLGAVGRAASVTGTGVALSGAAAAAGPVGIAVAGLVALAAALPVVTAALKAFANSVNESNRKLGDYNGTIAQAMARLDVRRIQNQISLGSQTEGSAAELAESIGEMEQALMPLKADTANLLNWLSSKGTEAVTLLANFYADTKSFFKDDGERAKQLMEWVKLIPGVDQKWADGVLEQLEQMNKPDDSKDKVETRGREFVAALREIGHHKTVHGVQERDPINPQWEDRGF